MASILDLLVANTSAAQAAERARKRNVLRDNAPIGSVGAPSGLLPNTHNPAPSMNPLDALALGLAPFPIAGDLAGGAADIRRLIQEPESRTVGNALLSGIGLLPFVPSAGTISPLNALVHRGGTPNNTGQFFSRNVALAKGFDKGQLVSRQAKTNKSLNFNDVLDESDLSELLRTMEREGDASAAGQLRQVLREDGAIGGADLFQIMNVIGSASPEFYLKRAGFSAIDTGRDVRVLNPDILQ